MEDDIEATLEEEFPPEEDTEDTENDENEDAAAERLEAEIEERYVTDGTHLVTVTVKHKQQCFSCQTLSACRTNSTVY